MSIYTTYYTIQHLDIMENQIIADELNKIVNMRGGKQSYLKDIDVRYINQYDDDGSLEYDMMINSLIAKIAKQLFTEDVFNKDPVAAMANVKDSQINKILKALRKARDIEIKELRRIDALSDPIIERGKSIKRLKNRDTAYNELRDVKLLERENLLQPREGKIRETYEKEVKRIVAPQYEDEALKKMIGYAGTGRKRPLSDYNKFVKSYFAKHPNATMKSAAAAWKK